MTTGIVAQFGSTNGRATTQLKGPDTHTPELGTYSTLFHAEQPHDIVHTNLSKQGITNCFAAYLGITLLEG